MRPFGLLLVLVAVFASGCSDAARYEDEVRAVPVPEGGILQGSDHSTSGAPRAHALYHYPDATSERALLEAVNATFEAAGWDVKLFEVHEDVPLGSPDVPRATLRAAKDGRLLDAEASRWTADYGGCCVFTDDKARPIGLYLTLFEDAANTAR